MAEETEIPTPEPVKISVFTPLIYVGLLLTIFAVFSIYYRKRRVEKFKEVKPIFKENYNALVYQQLKSQYNDKDTPKEKRPHEKLLKAALLRRAVEAIRRSMKLKENEPVFNKLYQNGLIGDDLFKQLEFEMKFQEIELKEIVVECESYKKGWAQTFFPLAQEICFNEALRRRLNAMEARSDDLAALWDYKADISGK
ncbi:Translocation protein S66 [Lodderomyces elongisporus]|uniref:Translocation protein S66 n=1 Tax=Lodderomyces elongisporus TaxID=36914 RepID=UPI002924428F|nr:Translocation protein S66 [Lodderomyces elongisporus]WLF80555.1 Translocation protein S66 [Lodderomyces elongisporus]